MSRGHRPGHRERGREGSPSHPSGDRILVLPGDEVPSQGLKPGPGAYRVGGKVYASVLGLVSHRPPLVHVIPLSGRYIPKAGDVVVGTVTDVQTTFWLLDIGAPRWAPLHMTGTPWKVDVGETERYLHVQDSVVVRVENLEATGRIGVTMAGEGLGKLEGGTLVRVSPARIPRVVGRGGSMVETITRLTGARIGDRPERPGLDRRLPRGDPPRFGGPPHDRPERPALRTHPARSRRISARPPPTGRSRPRSAVPRPPTRGDRPTNPTPAPGEGRTVMRHPRSVPENL